jgi:hypothetical protein
MCPAKAHLGPQEPLEENIATGLSRDSFHLIDKILTPLVSWGLGATFLTLMEVFQPPKMGIYIYMGLLWDITK